MTTSVDEIKAIYSGANALTDTQIESVIVLVSELVGELFINSGYSDVMTNAIERYMVAHYLAVAYDNGGVTRKRVGTSEEEYRTLSTDATGLASTIFGQQAQALDIKGVLVKMAANPVRAEFRVI